MFRTNEDCIGFYTSKERAQKIARYKHKKLKRVEQLGLPTRHCGGRSLAARRKKRVNGRFVK